jgi:hypothetical protein
MTTRARELIPEDVKDVTQLYAEGGRVQNPDQMTHKPFNKAANPITQLVRGWAAGTAGLPGDMEGLARMLAKYAGANVDETPTLPTSDFYKEWLPGRDTNIGGEEVASLGSLFGGAGATLPAKYGIKAAKVAVRNAAVPNTLSKQAGVIKAPGGNWLSGSIPDAVKGLRVDVLGDTPRTRELLGDAVVDAQLKNDAPRAAINSWIDSKLSKYIRDEMASPIDPIRLAADAWPAKKAKMLAEAQAKIDAHAANITKTARAKGVPEHYLTEMRQQMIPLEKAKALIEARDGIHFTPESMPHRMDDVWKKREETGFPASSGTSPLAQKWEAYADQLVNTAKAELLQYPEYGYSSVAKRPGMEWINKVDPESRVYGINTPSTFFAEERGIGSLKFDHLIDELRNSLNPESGLPKELLWKYSDLGKKTVPDAVEQVSKINAYRAAQKAEADLLRANNTATVLHKEYPEAGLKWVELKKGELPEGWSEEFVETDLGKLRKFRDPKTGGLTATDPAEETLLTPSSTRATKCRTALVVTVRMCLKVVHASSACGMLRVNRM